jgi:catechol 2,3-dioxygenase
VNKYHQAPLAYISTITLNVHDPKRMVDFYTQLGMRILSQTKHETMLGTSSPLLILKHDQDYALENKATQGLYHVAYLVPTRAELGSVLKHLIDQKIPLQGLSDHGVSEAIYLADPEGNGIEIYADRPSILWPYENKKLSMMTEMMKYKEVLSLATPFKGFSKETILGHLHLHVGDLKEAVTFYQEKLGYDLMQFYGDSAVFLSAGGYHHHLGLNTWKGTNISKKHPHTTGLISFQVNKKSTSIQSDIAGLTIQFID